MSAKHPNLVQVRILGDIAPASVLIGRTGYLQFTGNAKDTKSADVLYYTFKSSGDARTLSVRTSDILSGGLYKLVGVQMELVEDTTYSTVVLRYLDASTSADNLVFRPIDTDLWECVNDAGLSIVVGQEPFDAYSWRWSVMFGKNQGGATGIKDNRNDAIGAALLSLAEGGADISSLPRIQ